MMMMDGSGGEGGWGAGGEAEEERQRKGRMAQVSPAVRAGWLCDEAARDGHPWARDPPSVVVDPALAPTTIAGAASQSNGGGRRSESRLGLVPGWWASRLCCQ
jgi:hypothetical protein